MLSMLYDIKFSEDAEAFEINDGQNIFYIQDPQVRYNLTS